MKSTLRQVPVPWGRSFWLFPALVISLLVPTLPGLAGAVQCANVRCGDLDANGSVVASDALRLLHNAVGLDMEMVCPRVCGVSTSTTTITTSTSTTSTSTTSITTTLPTTTTTVMDTAACTITFALADDALELWWLQFDVDYSQAAGEVPECAVGPFVQVEIDDTESRFATILEANCSLFCFPISNRASLLSCSYEGPVPRPEQFSVAFVDTDVVGSPVVETPGSGVCGSPVTGLARPTFRDAMWIREAIGGVSSCPLCECDVDADGTVDGDDFQLVLDASLALPVEFSCPLCSYQPEVRGAADPVSVVVSDIDCAQ